MIRKFSPFIILSILLADQLSKLCILQKSMLLPMTVFPGFDLVLTWNRGISFGIFNSHPEIWFFYGLSFFIACFICYLTILLVREKKFNLLVVAYSFIIGGALGNFIDRLSHGAVVDFLDFYIGPYHWPAFNVADSFIILGVGIYFIFHCNRH